MRAGPGGKTSLRRSRSSSLEARIAGELPCDDAGQQARLDLQDAAVVHAVAEEGMRHQGVHALLVGSHERAAPCGRERNRRADANEVPRGQHSGVEGCEDSGVRDQGPELFHEVECQGGTSEARLMVETDEGIEADRMANDGYILHEQAVGEGKESVDGIARRSAVAMQEIELGPLSGIDLDHPAKVLEVEPRGSALDAEECIHILGARGLQRQVPESTEDRARRILVVPLQECPLVADLRGYETSCHPQAEGRLVGAPELIPSQEHVLQAEPLGEAVKPTAERKVRNRLVCCAQALKG